MKSIHDTLRLLLLSALIALAGCGSGGPSSSSSASSSSPPSSAPPSPPPSAPTATRAAVKLSTQGTLPEGKQLAGIAVLIKLPAGVTVRTDASGAVAAGVVAVSGVATQSGVTVVGPQIYTPATATTSGTLEFLIAAGNFGIGEFAMVTFELAPGSAPPAATDVTISPADQGLNPVTTLSVGLTATTS